MSKNLELVRSIYTEWERGHLDALEWAHPKIEFTMFDGPDAGTWTGPEATAQLVRCLLSVMAAWRDEAEEYRELDSKRVLVLDRFIGRRMTHDGQVFDRVPDVRGAHLFHLRGGKVTRLIIYMKRDHALADLGLAE